MGHGSRAVCTSQHGEGATARRPYERRESLLAVIINARMPGVPRDGTCTSRRPASWREVPSWPPVVCTLTVDCTVSMVMVSSLRTNGPWRLSAARGGATQHTAAIRPDARRRSYETMVSVSTRLIPKYPWTSGVAWRIIVGGRTQARYACLDKGAERS